MATGEIADSVREIASFRTKIKDIGSKVAFLIMIFFTMMMKTTIANNLKVFEMDAEVEEMTRDRRNNILIHGLPVQEGAPSSSLLTSQPSCSPQSYPFILI